MTNTLLIKPKDTIDILVFILLDLYFYLLVIN